MALDFGYNGETKPYIKFDARVGILKVKLNKEEEPQLKYPVRFAADIANTRQLHLCFPSDGPPRRLYFDNGVGAANIPPALGEHEFKIGFEVYLFCTDPIPNGSDGKRVGIVPWCACSVGATMSFNQMHDLWLQNDGASKVDSVPVYVCTGSEAITLGKGATNVLQFVLDKWEERAKIPGLAESIASRPGSNVLTPSRDSFALQSEGGDNQPSEPNDDLPF